MYVFTNEAYRAKLVHVSCHLEHTSGGLDESRDYLTSACCELLLDSPHIYTYIHIEAYIITKP
jgi:hypothetical protein